MSLLSVLIIFLLIQTTIAENFNCEKDGFFPDKHDCWIYHICAGTSHSVKACKDELLFNPIKNECDWSMNVNCNHTIQAVTQPPTNALQPTNVNIPVNDDYLCGSIENDYVAHPTDCKRYAYCANGIAQPKVCKKSLLWSQAEKMCVWPAQSDCPVKNLNPTSSHAASLVRGSPWIPQGTTYPSSYILTDAPSSLNIHKPLVICPSTQSWRVPDPYDCSIYHDCNNGTDRLSYCPAQFQYNPEKQKCDHTQNVQCKNKCTIKNEGARFVDPISCCHFYECISGKLILQTCSHSHVFDIQTRRCLPHKRVKCDGRRQCLSKCHDGGKKSCDSGLSCAGHSDGFYLDRTKPNCQSYIQCLDNRVANYSRCPHGQRFNKNMGRCFSADQVPCLASTSTRMSLLILILQIASMIIL